MTEYEKMIGEIFTNESQYFYDEILDESDIALLRDCEPVIH